MNTPFSLDGKKILVTGASSGIGRSIAIVLAEQGATLYITARNEERLLEIFNMLRPGQHKYIITDQTQPTDIATLVATIESVDGAVFCAGMVECTPSKSVDIAMVKAIMDVNHISQIALYQSLHKNKKLKMGSSLVFIGSVSAYTAVPATLAYSASKAAILASVRVLASELSKLKIRVNSISPGLIRTPLLSNSALDEEALVASEAKYPLGMGNPEDVANAAVFLLSEASRKITGIDLIVDGGYMLHQ